MWSPDATKIAFVSTSPEGPQHYLRSYIFAIKPDGTNRLQLTQEAVSNGTRISWSPDGTRLAFLRAFGAANVTSICVVGANGSGSTRITNAPLRDQDPTWSATDRISFIGTRDPGGVGIYSMKPDGTDTRLIKAPVGQFYGPAKWSPDGTKLLYAAPNKGGVTIIKADGTEAQSIGESSPDEAQWSRDGHKIVFVEAGGSGRVSVSVDARVATAIPNTASAHSPTLSPDGQMVAFVKNDGIDPVGLGTAHALFVTSIGSGTPLKLPIAVRPHRIRGQELFSVSWCPIADPVLDPEGDRSRLEPPPGTGALREQPKVESGKPTGPGFPGTPVGPDRPASPPEGSKSYGSDLKISAPVRVRVGNGFFGPEPLKIGVTRSAKISKSPVKFTVLAVPAGMTATISGNDSAAQLTLGGLSSLPIGEHVIQVKATCSTASALAPIRIIREKARILLVDDDFEGNNVDLDKDPANFLKGTLSKSDVFYRKMLDRGDGKRSLIFDTVGVDRYGNGPNAAALSPYDLVIWYLGPSYGGNPDNSAVYSGTDETNIRAYLQEGGGRTILMAGPGYISNVSHGTPTSVSNEAHWKETDSTFLQKAMGVAGGRGLFVRFTDADLSVNGETYMMGKGPVEAQLSPINPQGSTALALAEMDPDGAGKRMVPVAVWNRVGDANLVFVGFSLENVTVKGDKLAALFLGIRIPGMVSR